jgi:toxin CcdB
MAQFTVYRNKNPKSKADIPYFVDVQSDLLSELGTRVVIPLYLKKSLPIKPMTKLTPELQIEGKNFILMTPQMAGISIKDIGDEVCEITKNRNDIISSIDLLITGF